MRDKGTVALRMTVPLMNPLTSVLGRVAVPLPRKPYLYLRGLHLKPRSPSLTLRGTSLEPRSAYLNSHNPHLKPRSAYLNSLRSHLNSRSAHLKPHRSHLKPRSAYLNSRRGHLNSRSAHLKPRGDTQELRSDAGGLLVSANPARGRMNKVREKKRKVAATPMRGIQIRAGEICSNP